MFDKYGLFYWYPYMMGTCMWLDMHACVYGIWCIKVNSMCSVFLYLYVCVVIRHLISMVNISKPVILNHTTMVLNSLNHDKPKESCFINILLPNENLTSSK